MFCTILAQSYWMKIHEMRSCCMDTANRNKMLDKAFDKEDVVALKSVIGLLRKTLAAHPAGPAAAVPSPPVHDVSAPAPGQTRLQQWIQILHFSLLANDIDAARKASHNPATAPMARRRKPSWRYLQSLLFNTEERNSSVMRLCITSTVR